MQKDGPVITPDFFPQNYKAVNHDKPKLRKDSSSKDLDIPLRNNDGPHGKLKRSEILYIEEYRDELEVFSYNLKPEESE